MSIRGAIRYLWKSKFRKEPSMLETGTAAPEVEAKDQSGMVRRLSDYRGSYVVLWFFPKANTPG